MSRRRAWPWLPSTTAFVSRLEPTPGVKASGATRTELRDRMQASLRFAPDRNSGSREPGSGGESTASVPEFQRDAIPVVPRRALEQSRVQDAGDVPTERVPESAGTGAGAPINLPLRLGAFSRRRAVPPDAGV